MVSMSVAIPASRASSNDLLFAALMMRAALSCALSSKNLPRAGVADRLRRGVDGLVDPRRVGLDEAVRLGLLADGVAVVEQRRVEVAIRPGQFEPVVGLSLLLQAPPPRPARPTVMPLPSASVPDADGCRAARVAADVDRRRLARREPGCGQPR